MNRKSKISLYLLFTGVVLFLVLSVFMVWNAYQSAERQFKFTKQYYLSTAFFQSGMDGKELSPLADTIDYMTTRHNGETRINRHVIDSITYLATQEYQQVEGHFAHLLEKNGVDAKFNTALVVNKLHIKQQDSLIRIYDFEHDSTYLLLSGRVTGFDLGKPDNSFFYNFNQFNLHLQIAIYVHFPSIGTYLLSQVRLQLIIAACMLLLFLGIVLYTAKTIRKQQRVDQMKTDFINNMTHELKTPLATLSVAAKTINHAKIEDTSTLITNQVKRLERVVNRVMELSVLNKQDINKENIPVMHFFEAIVEGFRSAYSATEVRFQNIDTHSQVLADPFLLETAVVNLLDNAMKYAGHGLVQLTVEQKNGGLHVAVKDEGPGIARQYHKQIFEKFYRIPEGDRHEVKGSGLGLYYVKQIVAAHSGKVKIDSEQGRGTVVTLLIPLK